MTRGAREVFAAAIEGKSDEDVMELVERMGGTQAVLELSFDGMCERLVPQRSEDSVVRYELSHGGETHIYAVTIKDEQATWEKDSSSEARVTLQLSVPDYLRVIAGLLDGMDALDEGRLKLSGDLAFATKIAPMFGG